MKNIFFFTVTIIAHLFSGVLNGMENQFVHYKHDNSIAPLHVEQLSNLFDSAITEKWDVFKQSLASYTGPLNVFDGERLTLMHLAVIHNQEKVVSMLITKGASLNYNRTHRDASGTPLHFAAFKGYPVIAQLLINADKSIINLTDNQYGNTALHFAAWFDQSETIKMLIAGQADMNKINKMGSTPVHSASWRNSAASLKMLLESGANAMQANTTGAGNTPLYLAAKAGSVDCLQLLINHLKNKLDLREFIDHLNQGCAGHKDTAVQIAAVRDNVQCYWNLILAGADYNKKLKCADGTEVSVSDKVFRNEPVKRFIKSIEENGSANPPRHEGPSSACSICKADYIDNDVLMNVASCTHTVHVHCFQDHVIDVVMKRDKDSEDYIDLTPYTKGKSFKDGKHAVLTNPLAKIGWNTVYACPGCFCFNRYEEVGKISVFLK